MKHCKGGKFSGSSFSESADALVRLERDMRLHVHKENNVLFPRAIKLEAELVEKA
jgi:iron-sulfur cluster repair protein YtfE (RIC family)